MKLAAGIIAVSIFYFADICWRASRKPFWFDELFTVYLCRLPTLKATWTAVRQGADFNPPLFYLLTRASGHLFGAGRVGLRMPEILGVWVFGICLFFFVARRLGKVYGFVAGVLPFFTLAQYYAYEARPHGITLGWCGLALVSWQRIMEGSAKWFWHFAFCLVMLCCVLTHVYGVYLFIPFGLIELYSLWSRRQVHISIIAGLFVSGCVAVPLFLPMMRTYKVIMPPAGLPGIDLLDTFLRYVQSTMGAAIFLLILVIVFLTFESAVPDGWSSESLGLPSPQIMKYELMLAASFMSLPLFGIVGVKLTRAVFFFRYFLVAIAGFAIIFSHVAFRMKSKVGKRALVSAMLFLMCLDLGKIVLNTYKHRDDGLMEPSSNIRLPVDPAKEMEAEVAFLQQQPDLPILDISAPTYLYYYRYAPPSIVKRLYFGAFSKSDLFLVSYERLSDSAKLSLKTTEISTFLQHSNHFYVYSSSNTTISACGPCGALFLGQGYGLVSQADFADGTISEYRK